MTLSIRTFLLLLILAASIPLVVTVGYDFYSDREQSVAHSKVSLRTLAITMASNTGTKIADARHILERLAARPLIKQVNSKNCDPALKDIFTTISGYANIAFANTEGLVVCSVVPMPGGKPFDVSQRPWFQQAMKEKRFTIGHPLIGQATGKLVSVLSTPIWNDRQELVGTIFLPLDLEAFDPSIPDQFLPDGSRYGFFAEDGTMIWRNHDPEGVIGTRPNADAARRIVEVRDGEFESLAVDGVTRFFSVVPMPEIGWIAFVGVPAHTIYAEAKQQIIVEATIVLTAISFLILLATLIARRIARPIEELEKIVRVVRGGDLDARVVGGGPHEIAAVSHEFNAMVAERRGLEAVLRESESRFREIFNAVDDAIFIHDAKTGCIADVNRRMCEMYGLTREEALLCGPDDLSAGTPPYSAADAAQKIHLACTDGPQTFDWLARAHDGHLFWVEVSLRTALIGNQQRILAVVRDISERKRAEEELRIAAIAFESQDGMIVTDAHGVILRVNQAFTDITGYTAEEAIGQNPRLLSSGRHDKVFYVAMWKCIRYSGGWQGEIWNRRKNGEIYPEWLTITSVKGDTGEVTHYVATMHDITERKKAEEEINNLAFYDTLTQLPNRRMLGDRLGQAIAASKRSSHYGALMFLDLDNFKPLNDTYGHGVGDLLLIEVAHRLIGCVREVDTVARFGGDEFVVMLSELSEDKAESIKQASVVAEKIRTALAEPYLLAIKREDEAERIVEHRCAASIGVMVFNSDAGAEDIIKWADIAMYQAKEDGRNSICFYGANT